MKNDGRGAGGPPGDQEAAERDGGQALSRAFEGHALHEAAIQRLTGTILVTVSLSGIVMLGAWLHPDPYQGIRHWAARAAALSVYAALLSFFLWSLLRGRRRIAYLLVFGILLVGILSYHGATAYRANRERMAANEVLSALREGWRDTADLSGEERSNPYVDAWLTMRDVYWELQSRSETRMAHYRRLYGDYTRRGGFLDSSRLGSTYDLWYSYFQVHDLQQWLERASESKVSISDLLWGVSLLDVDSGTRAAYANDLRAAAAALDEAQAASIARERDTLREMKRVLDVLIDADGYYRVVGTAIIFERPEDAARFADKSDSGSRD